MKGNMLAEGGGTKLTQGRKTVVNSVGMKLLLAACSLSALLFAACLNGRYEVHHLFSASVGAMLFALLFGATARANASLFVASAVYCLFVAATKVKITYTGLGFQPGDLAFLWRDNWDFLLENYAKVFLAALAVGSAFVAVAAFLFSHEEKVPRYARRTSLAAALVGAALFSAAYAEVLADRQVMLRPEGIGFFVSRINKPAMAVDGREIAPAPLVREAGLAPGWKGKPPTVITILQESTYSNPSCGADRARPGFLRGNAAWGDLRVHTVSGGTWLSEFSLFMGLPTELFGDMAYYVNYLLVGKIKRSLPGVLSAAGYETRVVLPLKPTFVNGENFYRSIGFEHVESVYKKNTSGGILLDDAVLYDAVLDVLGSGNAPQYVHVLTISNHGPHDGEDPDGDYCNRLGKSEAAYREFEKALAAKFPDKKFLILNFGDHRPHFEAERNGKDLHETFYSLRAVNFCPGTGAATAPKDLDIAFLSDVLLNALGIGNASYGLRKEMAAGCLGDFWSCPESVRRGMVADVFDFVGPGDGAVLSRITPAQ